MARYRSYVIVSPDFDTTSGGIRVMWGLYGWLLAKGQEVVINRKPTTSDFIAIYPEIYQGNPTGSRHVVRYLLNKPGAMANYGVPGPQEFPSTDEIYVFSEIYNTVHARKDHVLFLPVINTHLFTHKHLPRDHKCVFYGHKQQIEHEFTKGLFCVNRAFANDQGALAEYLNACEVMYSYQPISAMHEIARLCGCRVVVIPDGSYTREQMDLYEPGMNGISWGVNEYKKLKVVEFRDHYHDMIKIFDNKLDEFIDTTQSML